MVYVDDIEGFVMYVGIELGGVDVFFLFFGVYLVG